MRNRKILNGIDMLPCDNVLKKTLNVISLNKTRQDQVDFKSSKDVHSCPDFHRKKYTTRLTCKQTQISS